MINDTIMIFCYAFSTSVIAGTCLLLVTPKKPARKAKVKLAEKSIGACVAEEYPKLHPRQISQLAQHQYLLDKYQTNSLGQLRLKR